MSGVIQQKIEAAQDEHVFILIETPGRPSISIDIEDAHGRRSMSVRLNGMGFAGLLVDAVELAPMEENAWLRFCPYCGEKLNDFSSRPHQCAEPTRQSSRSETSS